MKFLSQRLSRANTFSCIHILHTFCIPYHLITSSINTGMFAFLDIPYKIVNKYYTRSKARAMAEDQAVRVEWLEKAHLEL